MENNDNEFSYVQEKIKPKNKKRIRKALIIAGTTIVCAVVFGFLARLVFVTSEGVVNKLLGITPSPTPTPYVEEKRNKVDLPNKKISPTDTPTPTVMPIVAPTDAENTPAPVTVEPAPTDPPSPTPSNAGGQSEKSALENYVEMMSELRGIADEAYKSLVRIYSVTTGINWMDESVETRREVSGAVIADNGVELLILADYTALADADRIEVEFADRNVVEGKLLCADKDAKLSVVAVELDKISEKTKSGYKYCTLGDSSKLYGGQPVIAIGRPNGYYGAVLFGFVTKMGLKSVITDGEAELITTDIEFNAESDGIIITLDGTVVGLVGSVAGTENVTMQGVGINSMKELIVKLLNDDPVAYYGIKAEDMPADILSGLSLDHGIYVNEVIAGSPAHTAGIKKGDIITSLQRVEMTDSGIKSEGAPSEIKSLSAFYDFILKTEAGKAIETKVFRSSKREEPHVTVHVQTTIK